MTKWVYTFGDGKAEGDASMRNLLGGKGANLAEMNVVGLPVPPGFTVTTEVCTYYYNNNHTYPADLKEQVKEAVAGVEKIMGKKFADANNPLLFSVRSGARVSMPGMMDTVLNLGLNDETVKALAKASGSERFAYDSYRRFLQMFSDVVLGADLDLYEEALENMKKSKGYKSDTDLTAEDLKELVKEYKEIGQKLGKVVPQDPWEQLWAGIGAVFGSWMVDRAITYRKLNNIPGDWGTAVNVQTMVFGNAGDDCATGVCFSRDPATGENVYYGEYLINAQGEDVVAGIRTPQPMASKGDGTSLEEKWPHLYKELVDVRNNLEAHYKDMQDMEFTIEHGKLWMLQCRNGKRTAQAAVRMAVEMVEEGLLNKEEAIMRVGADQLDQLLHPMLDPKAPKKVIATGLPASPGAAVGRAVFNAEDAEAWAAKGEKVILIRNETSPEDIGGMHASQGVITARGGMTSHAAVVARGMGTPCVSGSHDIVISYKDKTMTTKSGAVVKEGDWVSLDGAKGQIIEGQVPTVKADTNTGNFGKLMGWVDEIRTMEVRANAETPKDAQTARDFGAQGIGLARTEHMFFDAERIPDMRAMILSENEEGRRAALARLLPYQKQDFKDLFKIMEGMPVVIRLLDPPLHEFLPHTDAEMQELADKMGMTLQQVKNRANALHEANPMLGHRGCRLPITYPEICEMQTRAILEAAIECADNGVKVLPEIEVPLTGSKKELDIVKDIIDTTAEKVFAEKGKKIKYEVGSMIELPRAALKADELAQSAEFFGFGTNDLTQTTLGMSRDDTGAILDEYRARGVYVADPFASIDVEGVGCLVKLACEKARSSNPKIWLGVCGEHGGDPASIDFFQTCGMNYVSCSPFRVPVARLAAAQAAVRHKNDKKEECNSSCCCKKSA
ncbi:MAG: pyruvate, phosphate dikinase [Azospirillum sp.]|jgi:pyruvate, phosphate dikinase|nr:pyruvate, phosphate dikinase [Azospirillum sp.]CDB52729.1 pyruvate phosphate dikinase [Azospirillum sp. CAG:239]